MKTKPTVETPSAEQDREAKRKAQSVAGERTPARGNLAHERDYYLEQYHRVSAQHDELLAACKDALIVLGELAGTVQSQTYESNL